MLPLLAAASARLDATPPDHRMRSACPKPALMVMFCVATAVAHVYEKHRAAEMSDPPRAR
jgi:hypothetical protein